MAQPVKSVQAEAAATTTCGERCDNFDVTVTAYGPALQAISEEVRKLNFLKRVANTLRSTQGDGRAKVDLREATATYTPIQVEGPTPNPSPNPSPNPNPNPNPAPNSTPTPTLTLTLTLTQIRTGGGRRCELGQRLAGGRSKLRVRANHHPRRGANRHDIAVAVAAAVHRRRQHGCF